MRNRIILWNAFVHNKNVDSIVTISIDLFFLLRFNKFFLRKQSHWVPQVREFVVPWPVDTRLVLKSRTQTGSNIQRLLFEISGPDHMALFISPKLGNRIVNWTPLDKVQTHVPEWGER